MDNNFKQTKRTTIKDVAKLANVAVSTVSRVYNGKDKVSDETRKKVQDAMAMLDYKPSTIATSMITGSTNFILIMVPRFENPFFSVVLTGIEEMLYKRGYYSLVLTTKNYSNNDYLKVKNKFDAVIDGIIAVPNDNYNFFEDWGKPCVLIDRCIQNCNLNSIVSNNFHGSCMLMEELIAAGHTKIAIINSKDNIISATERTDGYRYILKKENITINPQYTILDEFSVEAGYNNFIKLINLPDPPTAIFATNDLICIGCMQACHDLGLNIGKDISLVGYDNHKITQYFQPGITVIEQPSMEMGRQAVLNLLQQINGEYAPHQIVLDVSLIRRGSVLQLQQDLQKTAE